MVSAWCTAPLEAGDLRLVYCPLETGGLRLVYCPSGVWWFPPAVLRLCRIHKKNENKKTMKMTVRKI